MFAQGPARILAGGTDILVGIRNGTVQPQVLIDIKDIPELKRLELDKDELVIGAAVTVNELICHPVVREKFPILVDAGEVLGSYQVRNRATVAGNLCNASPAADMAPALLVLGATVNVFGGGSRRELPLAKLFTGVKKTSLQPGEILTEIRVPLKSGRGKYLRQGRTRGHDLAILGLAGFYGDGVLRLAVGACAATPVCVELSAAGENRDGVLAAAREKLQAAIHPIDDVRASAEYRRALVNVYLERVLAAIL